MKKILLCTVLVFVSLIFVSCGDNEKIDFLGKKILIIDKATDHVVKRYQKGLEDDKQKFSIYDLSKGTTCESLGFVKGKDIPQVSKEFTVKRYVNKYNEKLICIYATFAKDSLDYGTFSKLIAIEAK